jgi:hypothetical protein
MTRKLLKTVSIVVIALAPLIAAGSAKAHGGGFHGGGFHGGGFHGDGFHGDGFHDDGFHGGGFGRGGFGDRGFGADRFRFGGFLASIPATMAAITLAITDTAPAI